VSASVRPNIKPGSTTSLTAMMDRLQHWTSPKWLLARRSKYQYSVLDCPPPEKHEKSRRSILATALLATWTLALLVFSRRLYWDSNKVNNLELYSMSGTMCNSA
jgi:hypothetical protein